MKAVKTDLCIDVVLLQKSLEEHFAGLGHSVLPAQVLFPDVGFSDFYGESVDMPSEEGEQGCVSVCGPGEGKQDKGGPDQQDFFDFGSANDCGARPAKRARVDLYCHETMHGMQ